MDLILVGAGAFGREVFTWLSQAIEGNSQYKIKGFIDNLAQNQIELDLREYPIPILGTINDYYPKSDEKLVMSIFDPKLKKQSVELLLKRGSKFHKLRKSFFGLKRFITVVWRFKGRRSFTVKVII